MDIRNFSNKRPSEEDGNTTVQTCTTNSITNASVQTLNKRTRRQKANDESYDESDKQRDLEREGVRVHWTPLRNDEVGCKVYETIEEDEKGNEVVVKNYNTWSGFYYNKKQPEETEQNKKYLEIHKRIIKNLAGHPDNQEHDALINFLHMKIAVIIQRPDELSRVGEYIYSNEATGKGYKGEIIIKLLASNEIVRNGPSCRRHSYGMTFVGPNLMKSEHGLFGRFNSFRSKLLFIHVSDYSTGQTPKKRIRSAITDTNVVVRKKNKKDVIEKNYAAFYVEGRDFNFDVFDRRDRRWCLTNGHSTMNDVEIDDENIWVIANRMKNDESFLTYLFHWYKNYTLPENLNWEEMIPHTFWFRNL